MDRIMVKLLSPMTDKRKRFIRALSLKLTLACSPYLSTGLIAPMIAAAVFVTSEFKAMAEPVQTVGITGDSKGDIKKVALMSAKDVGKTKSKDKTNEQIHIDSAASKPGKTTRETVAIDGRERQYFQHIPSHYNSAKPTAVMLVFNGWGNKRGQGNSKAGAEGTEQFTGLSEKADKENFIVVYLDGYQKNEYSWNNGQWFFSKENDLEFTNRVIEVLKHSFNIDKERLYLVGYSQGASFAHRFATTFPEKIAAVASVGGWITGKEQKPTCSPYSCIEIHSASDPTVPLDGRSWWLKMKPQEELKKFYRAINGMDSEPQRITTKAPDGSEIKTEISKCKANGTEFRYITIDNIGHKWFGGKGAESAAINATDTIWDFLKDKKKSVKA